MTTQRINVWPKFRAQTKNYSVEIEFHEIDTNLITMMEINATKKWVSSTF